MNHPHRVRSFFPTVLVMLGIILVAVTSTFSFRVRTKRPAEFVQPVTTTLEISIDGELVIQKMRAHHTPVNNNYHVIVADGKLIDIRDQSK